MPYDPSKPANNSPINSAELRAQFAGLKTLIDTRASGIASVSALNVEQTDPPSADEVAVIVDKINELIAALKQ